MATAHDIAWPRRRPPCDHWRVRDPVQPGWRSYEWLFVASIEYGACSIVLSWVDKYCRLDKRPALIMFLASQVLIAIGLNKAEP
jgi:hypothetical protein